jgi:hypothetical protein
MNITLQKEFSVLLRGNPSLTFIPRLFTTNPQTMGGLQNELWEPHVRDNLGENHALTTSTILAVFDGFLRLSSK